MANMKWVYEHDKNSPFINPYQFVSASKKVMRSPVEKGNLTGKISCRIKVKEQLAIPNSVADKPQKYDFFNVDGRYMIPGSEIRGCIRSAYETVTSSCFSIVNSEILSAREAKPNLSRKPGILMRRDNEWVIYEAVYYNEKHYHKYKHKIGEPDVVRKWQKKGNKPELCETYFYFEEDDEGYLKRAAVCTEADILKLRRAYEVYLANLTNDDIISETANEEIRAIRSYIQLLNDMQNTEEDDDMLLPLFYQCSKGGNIVYISPAHTGRKVHENTVPKLLGEHDKCTGKSGLYCPSCSLFGTLGDNAPIASRVRFSDAVMTNGSISDYKFLPELASPKISTVEFYSNQSGYTSDSPRWNYDDKNVSLKGRKYYLHGIPKEADELGTRQVAVKTANKNSEFIFDVFFDKITEKELKTLLWVLTIGDNDIESNYMHKLGMGKPVGYGSVKIVVDDVTQRSFDAAQMTYSLNKMSFADYAVTEDETDELFDRRALADFMLISDYSLTVDGSNERIRIAYPMGEKLSGKNSINDRAGHQWFTSNRAADGKFRDVLPRISANVEEMRLYNVVGKQIEVLQKGEKRSPKKHYSDTGSSAVLVEGERYQAKIIGHFTSKNGKERIKIEVCGLRDNLPAVWFPQRIQQDLDGAVASQDTVWVTFRGTNTDGYRQYQVDKKL